MKRENNKNKHLYPLSLGLGAIIAIIAWAFIFAIKEYNGTSQWIYIPHNADSGSIRDSLETRLGSAGTNAYFLWEISGGNPCDAHGAYLVKDGDRAYNIGKRLMRGQQTPVRVTINNIRTVRQLSERIARKMEWDGDDFITACSTILPGAGFKVAEFPAAFLPDTYEFYWNASPESVVTRLLDYRNNFWDANRRQKAKAIGLNPVKVATLASIVEEETNAIDERPVVARLYLNRLKKGMMLQADPTVKFAVGDLSIRRITGKHLAVESPYNTYRNTGLPPGPIRIPEKAAIDAVLDAPEHNYIYMCAKEDFSGRHNFAADYATHQRNAGRYRSELNRRGIR
ncbi:MAG: endolytic transglycosylase MltG [Muribaculaceae bacterium]|nr:endolytic transglycosylase MltG [Muribaculaceae bacterium]